MNVLTGERHLKITPPKVRLSVIPVVAFSPDGRTIALGQNFEPEGRIYCFDTENGKLLSEFGNDSTRRLEFSPDGRLLLQKARDTLVIWDVVKGEQLWAQSPSNTSHLNIGNFSPDGKALVATDGKEKKIVRFDALTGKPLFQFDLQEDRSSVNDIILRPDGSAVTIDRRGYINLYNTSTGKMFREVRTVQNRAITNCLLVPGPRKPLILSVCGIPNGRQMIQMWNVENGDLVASILGGVGRASAAERHPLTDELVVAGEIVKAWELKKLPDFRSYASATKPDFRFLGSDHKVIGPGPNHSPRTHLRFWNLYDERPEGTWMTVPFARGKLDVSSNGKRVIISSSAHPAIFSLFETPGPGMKEVASFSEDLFELKLPYEVQQLCLSPSGHLVVIVMGNLSYIDCFIVDPKTGDVVTKIDLKSYQEIHDLKWIDDTSFITVGTRGAHRTRAGSVEEIAVWNVNKGTIAGKVSSNEFVDVLDLEPGGSRFAEAGVDKQLRIRDLQSLEIIDQFRVHNGPVTALAWHPKLDVIASASEDNSIRFWEVETGDRINECKGLSAPPTHLNFSPSGRRLACAADNGMTHVFELPFDELEPEVDSSKFGIWEDLLASIDPGKTNLWQLKNGALYSPNSRNATCPLPGSFFDSSYRLKVKLQSSRIRNS